LAGQTTDYERHCCIIVYGRMKLNSTPPVAGFYGDSPEVAITVCVPTAHIDIAVVIGGTSGAQCRGNDLGQSIAPFIFRRIHTTYGANIYTYLVQDLQWRCGVVYKHIRARIHQLYNGTGRIRPHSDITTPERNPLTCHLYI